MIRNYCELLLLLYDLRSMYYLLWVYDMTNIDLQLKLLKVHYEIKDTKMKLRQALRNED